MRDDIEIRIDKHVLEEWYDQGMSVKVDEVRNREDIDFLGGLTDAAELLGRPEGLHHALDLALCLANSNLDPSKQATLHYFIGNIHSNLRDVESHAKPWDAWSEFEEGSRIEDVVLSYRRSIMHPGFNALPVERRCQVFTNLGNVLSRLGLHIESVALYDKALRLDPSFAMARGNRATAAIRFSTQLYDVGHQWVYLRYAYADLATAVSFESDVNRLEHDAYSFFASFLEWCEERIGGHPLVGHLSNAFSYSLGESHEEETYRKWCLRNRLFLNPLNDLGAYPIAARDVLTTPPLIAEVGAGPKWQGAFNQLKQSYVSARFLLFEGLTSVDPHFSDREVLLYDTFDLPSYSLAVEKIRLAFRSLYSLLDQMAFLLNDYLDLAIRPRDISFRSMWYVNKKPKEGTRPEILARSNAPLQALFWIGKDLFEKRPGYSEAMEPEARQLFEIRNHLEHRYLKVHEMLPDEYTNDERPPWTTDQLAYSVERGDLAMKALHLATLVRSALTYLSLAMNIENRAREKAETKVRVPIALSTVPIDLKF